MKFVTFEEFEQQLVECIKDISGDEGPGPAAEAPETFLAGRADQVTFYYPVDTAEVDYGAVLEKMRSKFGYDINNARALLCRWAIWQLQQKG